MKKNYDNVVIIEKSLSEKTYKSNNLGYILLAVNKALLHRKDSQIMNYNPLS